MGMPFDDEVGYRPSAYTTVTSGLRGIPKPAPMTEPARQSKIHLNDDGSRKFKSSSLQQPVSYLRLSLYSCSPLWRHIGAVIRRKDTTELVYLSGAGRPQS